MRYKVASFDQIAAHPDAITHAMDAVPSEQPIILDYCTLTDVSRDLVELRDAIIVPGGGIVWNGFWINGLEIHYYATSWAAEDWRPGDLDETDGTIDIPDSRLAPDQIIECPALFCDSHWASINFGHFVHDLMPYGRLFRLLREKVPDAVPLISAMSWAGQREILGAVFELPEARFFHAGVCTMGRRLFVARRQSVLDGKTWTTSFQGLRDARQLALRGLGQATIASVSRATHPLRIFLHRRLDPSSPHYKALLAGRNFSNVDQLALALLDAGFVGLEPGRIPVRLVATLISRAHLIVGVHGANMGNILFGHPDAHVVEIRGAHGAWDDYAAVAAVLGQKHHALRQPYPFEGMPPALDVTAILRFLATLRVD